MAHLDLCDYRKSIFSINSIFTKFIEVHRRNPNYKNLYCKSLVALFIFRMPFFRCLQLFLCNKNIDARALEFLPTTFKLLNLVL